MSSLVLINIWWNIPLRRQYFHQLSAIMSICDLIQTSVTFLGDYGNSRRADKNYVLCALQNYGLQVGLMYKVSVVLTVCSTILYLVKTLKIPLRKYLFLLCTMIATSILLALSFAFKTANFYCYDGLYDNSTASKSRRRSAKFAAILLFTPLAIIIVSVSLLCIIIQHRINKSIKHYNRNNTMIFSPLVNDNGMNVSDNSVVITTVTTITTTATNNSTSANINNDTTKDNPMGRQQTSDSHFMEQNVMINLVNRLKLFPYIFATTYVIGFFAFAYVFVTGHSTLYLDAGVGTATSLTGFFMGCGYFYYQKNPFGFISEILNACLDLLQIYIIVHIRHMGSILWPISSPLSTAATSASPFYGKNNHTTNDNYSDTIFESEGIRLSSFVDEREYSNPLSDEMIIKSASYEYNNQEYRVDFALSV